MNLPRIEAPIRRPNPAWTKDNGEEYYITIPTWIEILQLNLSTDGMRVRYIDADPTRPGKERVCTTDISIEYFFKDYSIVKNG